MVINRQSAVIALGIIAVVGLAIWSHSKSSSSNVAGTTKSASTLSQAVAKLSQGSTYHTQMSLQLHLPPTINSQPRPYPEETVTLDGDVRQVGTTSEFVGRLHGEAKGQGSVLFTDGDIQILDNGVYFNLDTLPALLDPTSALTHKWTFVDTKLLHTKNAEDINKVVTAILPKFTSTGADTIEGTKVTKYTATLSGDDEQKLQDVLKVSASDNQAYNTLARLLTAFDTDSVTLLVDEQSNVRQLAVTFHEPGQADTKRAELTINWQDFGKSVTINQAQPVTSAAPQAFGQFFGTVQVVPSPTPTALPTIRKR